jgi:hypothetical protein
MELTTVPLGGFDECLGGLLYRNLSRRNNRSIHYGGIDSMEKSIRIAIVVLIVLILTVINYHLRPKGERKIIDENDSEYILEWLSSKNAEPCTLTPVSKDVWHCKKSNGEKYIIKR